MSTSSVQQQIADVNVSTDDSSHPSPSTSPLKVYILMGQSNMLGFGRVQGDVTTTRGTLTYVTQVEGKFPHLVNKESGKWTIRNDVWLVQTTAGQKRGWLQPGTKFFGPELQFGHVIGDYHQRQHPCHKKPASEEEEEWEDGSDTAAAAAASSSSSSSSSPSSKVLLVKASQGNRSLGWDILPPSSERFEYNGRTYAGYGDSPASWVEGQEKKQVNWYGGKQYDDYVKDVKEVLGNLRKFFPDYKGPTTTPPPLYEIMGFVWWQGHKDQCAAPYPDLYEGNLVRLIKSLRNDFDAPNAKFVLATIAFGGREKMGKLGRIVVDAQLAVDGDGDKYPEFRHNVKTMDVRDCWRERDVSPCNQAHHYNQNAETYLLVGDALGRGMVELLERDRNAAGV